MRDDHPLPNLSAWHELPASALIPAGTEYATQYPNGDIVVHTTDGDYMPFDDDNRYFTEKRILPKLPTKFGAMIRFTDGHYLVPGLRAVLVAPGDEFGWQAEKGFNPSVETIIKHGFEVIHDG